MKFLDLTNQKLKYFTAIKFSHKEGRDYYWECTCNCGSGEKFILSTFELRRGHKKYCTKCKPKHSYNFKDITNQKFNNLIVIKFEYIKNTRAYWLCKCICNIEIIVCTADLKNGNTKSCGCIMNWNPTRISFRHGDKNQRRVHNIWHNMIQRCTNAKHPQYYDYGGRGVKVCSRWLKFENFINDEYNNYLKHVAEFGEKDTTADRYPNVNGNYEAKNFRWATRQEQSENRRRTTQSNDIQAHHLWRMRISACLINALKEKQFSSIYEKYLGCSLLEFRNYMQSLWEPWMNWDNYGQISLYKETWNIGHIKGCNNFDLSKEEDRLVCFNYKNLKPQRARENSEQTRILEIA
jgi:hypothetical protein